MVTWRGSALRAPSLLSRPAGSSTRLAAAPPRRPPSAGQTPSSPSSTARSSSAGPDMKIARAGGRKQTKKLKISSVTFVAILIIGPFRVSMASPAQGVSISPLLKFITQIIRRGRKRTSEMRRGFNPFNFFSFGFRRSEINYCIQHFYLTPLVTREAR